jgi:hypothetical protein
VSLPDSLVRAIAEAVEREGGDMEDVDDLVAVWKRVERRNGGRAVVIRREARELTQRMRTEDEP